MIKCFICLPSTSPVFHFRFIQLFIRMLNWWLIRMAWLIKRDIHRHHHHHMELHTWTTPHLCHACKATCHQCTICIHLKWILLIILTWRMTVPSTTLTTRPTTLTLPETHSQSQTATFAKSKLLHSVRNGRKIRSNSNLMQSFFKNKVKEIGIAQKGKTQ